MSYLLMIDVIPVSYKSDFHLQKWSWMYVIKTLQATRKSLVFFLLLVLKNTNLEYQV